MVLCGYVSRTYRQIIVIEFRGTKQLNNVDIMCFGQRYSVKASNEFMQWPLERCTVLTKALGIRLTGLEKR